MSSGNEYERLFKLWATVAKLIVDGRRSAASVAKVLQSIVSEAGYTLYLAPGQKNDGWVRGFILKKHLEETKLIDRAFSLEDELVKGWIANPSSYPEELKDKAVFLWGSRRASGDNVFVAFLIWNVDHVIVVWDWLENDWDDLNPALLASS